MAGRILATKKTPAAVQKKSQASAKSASSRIKSSKRKDIPAQDAAERHVAKKSKIKSDRKIQKPRAAAPIHPVLNEIPKDPLDVLVFGDGENGELGLGPKDTESLCPRINTFFDPNDKTRFQAVQLACGGMHTVALTADNQIVTWGVNDNGALGRSTDWDGGLRDADTDSEDEDGDLNPLESTPGAISLAHFVPGTNFAQVAAGDSCTFALTTTGLVYGWGTFRNPQGDQRFGYDAHNEPIGKQATPMLISGVKDIIQIVCGANHVLALDKHGDIWGWGSNEENQLGRRLFGRFQDSFTPLQLRVCRNQAAYIASGEYHSFAVDRQGRVWAWGRNSNFETGCDSPTSNSTCLPYPLKIKSLGGDKVKCLAGGANHSAAVTDDGRCLTWGRLDAGQLGLKFTPDQLQDTALIRRDLQGRPHICTRPTLVRDTGRITHVACGTDHTIFLDEAGSAHTTGFGFQGQLGLDSTDDAEVPQKIVSRNVKGRVLSWAGAGGRFSIVANVANMATGARR